MKCVCSKHGESIHYHTCRHVTDACDTGGPLPDFDLLERGLICWACQTAEVRVCLVQLDSSNIDVDASSDAEFEESIKRVFDAYHALQASIGYGPVCADCLHEKTGLDVRHRQMSTHL